jgi:hypothetical protein
VDLRTHMSNKYPGAATGLWITFSGLLSLRKCSFVRLGTLQCKSDLKIDMGIKHRAIKPMDKPVRKIWGQG